MDYDTNTTIPNMLLKENQFKIKSVTYLKESLLSENFLRKRFPWFPMFLKHYPCIDVIDDEDMHITKAILRRYVVLSFNKDIMLHIPSLLKVAYEISFDYLPVEFKEDQLPSVALKEEDYIYESIALLALGLFHKHLEDPARKQERINYLEHLYNQRKVRYREIAKGCPTKYGIVINHCTAPDALLVKKLVGVLLDFDDGLTRKRIMDYIKKFDGEHVKHHTQCNHDIFLEEFKRIGTLDYMQLLHDASLNFLVNIHKGINYEIAGSTFFSFAWLRLYYYGTKAIDYTSILAQLPLSLLDYTSSYKDSEKNYRDFQNLQERCENIITYQQNNQDATIDVYEACALTFETSRKNQLHSLSDMDAYIKYQNHILTCFHCLELRYPTIWNQSMEFQCYMFHSVVNFVELIIKQAQTKELLLTNESDDLLDEMSALLQENNILKEEKANLLKQKEEQEKELTRMHDKHSKEQMKACNEVEHKYQGQVIALQKELRQMEKEKNRALENEAELHTLREFVFSLQTQSLIECPEDDLDITAFLSEYFKQNKTIFIGGHLSLIQKLKEKYPMIHISIDRQVLSNQNMLDCVHQVFFLTDWLNHNAYHICMNYIQKKHINFSYLYGENINRIEQQLYTSINKTK